MLQSGRRTFGSLKRLKNDRCKRSCLSKIAHMLRIRVAPFGRHSNRGDFSLPCGIQRRTGIVSNTRLHGLHQFPGIFKFPPTLDADLVCPFLDCEHATQLAMMAPKSKLQDPKQEFHKLCPRCRRPVTRLKIRTTSATFAFSLHREHPRPDTFPGAPARSIDFRII